MTASLQQARILHKPAMGLTGVTCAGGLQLKAGRRLKRRSPASAMRQLAYSAIADDTLLRRKVHGQLAYCTSFPENQLQTVLAVGVLILNRCSIWSACECKCVNVYWPWPSCIASSHPDDRFSSTPDLAV